MVDSVIVWDPGTQILDSGGNAISGATIEFYDAGTSDAKTVYSDSALTASLGPIVYTDSSGAPVASSGSSTQVSVYVGTGAYKTIIKNGSGTTIETKDNLAGALDTSTFEAATVATPSYPVISKSADYTVVTGDRGKVINCNSTGGDITITLPSAVTMTDGWSVTIRHVGTANEVTVQTVSSQTISLPLAGGAAEAFEMVAYGEGILITSDGADWHVVSQVTPLKLGSGYHSIVYDNGTQTSGTLTPDPEEANFQKAVNGGAFTLAPPSKTTNIILQVTNNASAGTITTSGFTRVTGDTITTSDGDDFYFHITVVDSFSRLFVEALQ